MSLNPAGITIQYAAILLLLKIQEAAVLSLNLSEQQSLQSALLSQTKMKVFVLIVVMCPLSIVAKIRVLEEDAKSDASFEDDQADRSAKCNK